MAGRLEEKVLEPRGKIVQMRHDEARGQRRRKFSWTLFLRVRAERVEGLKASADLRPKKKNAAGGSPLGLKRSALRRWIINSGYDGGFWLKSRVPRGVSNSEAREREEAKEYLSASRRPESLLSTGQFFFLLEHRRHPYCFVTSRKGRRRRILKFRTGRSQIDFFRVCGRVPEKRMSLPKVCKPSSEQCEVRFTRILKKFWDYLTSCSRMKLA